MSGDAANEEWRRDPERLCGARRWHDRHIRELRAIRDTVDELVPIAAQWRDDIGRGTRDIHGLLFAAVFEAQLSLRALDREPTATYIGNLAAFGRYDPELPTCQDN